jgi:hypothetical protein
MRATGTGGRRVAIVAALTTIAMVGAACGGGDDEGNDQPTITPAEEGSADGEGSGGDGADGDGADGDGAGDDGAALPAECALPPYTAVVERTGPSPAGSATFGVVDAVVLPIPIVPDPDQQLSFDEAVEAAASTDLVGYSIVLADEDIADGSVSLFSGYEPDGEGTLRAFVSVFPFSADAPLRVGDVVTHSFETELGAFTSLSTIGLDLKASADEFNGYAESPIGQVEIIALTEDAACFDVDLNWTLSGDGGSVTIRGVLAGPLLERGNLPLS